MPDIDPATAAIAARNIGQKVRLRRGFREWQERKGEDYRYWHDSYGNLYQYYPFRKPILARFEVAPNRRRPHQVVVRRREFQHLKSAENWLDRIYRRKQAQWDRAQESKQARAEERERQRLASRPTKSQLVEKKIAKAEAEKRAIETRIRRLRTAIKKRNRRIAALKVALRKSGTSS